VPKKLRVGIIGSGGIAQGAHMPAWQKVKDAELVAVADIRPEAAKAAAERFLISPELVFTDYETMLSKVDLDVVSVCTPNVYHIAPTIAAFKAGCHVLVEKPIATSAAECRQMIAAGKKAGKLLCVAQSVRYTANALAMKRFVDEGKAGNIYWARAAYLRDRGVPDWGAFTDASMSMGGPCYDLAVHVLDLCLSLMGFPKPTAVSAATYLEIANKPSMMRHDPKKYTVPEDFAVGFVRFKNGASISVEASWAINVPSVGFNCVLAGTKGGMSYEPLAFTREEFGIVTRATPQAMHGGGGHDWLIAAFADAIRKGKPSPVPGEEALITQMILDAIYESGKTGREVAL
jgi:predicted dehydrogenase